VGRDGTATSTNTRNDGSYNQDNDTKTITKNDSNSSVNNDSKAKASDQAASIGRDGTATSNNNKSDAGGDGSASSNTGTATSTYSETTVKTQGDASPAVASGGGAASVNNSYLAGSVTGEGAGYALFVDQNGYIVPTSNSINGSYNNFAGINQSVQNSGNSSLAQQQVSFQGNVNVNQNTPVAP